MDLLIYEIKHKIPIYIPYKISEAIPCHLLNLPVNIAGIIIIHAAINENGISICIV